MVRGDLAVWRFADQERNRILRRYRKGERVHLYELSEMMDWVGTAAYDLEESMDSEHDGSVPIDLTSNAKSAKTLDPARLAPSPMVWPLGRYSGPI